MICVYDNPATWRRECWQDGKLIYSMSYEMFLVRRKFAPPKVHMGINLLGDWKEGQYVGDKKAMEQEV